MITGKIRNQRRLLQRQSARHPTPGLRDALDALDTQLAAVGGARDRAALMGIEGYSSRAHFAGLARLVDPALEFHGRRRRPPTDPVNSLLSFGYSLLTNEVGGACQQAGLDVFRGSRHRCGSRSAEPHA